MELQTNVFIANEIFTKILGVSQKAILYTEGTQPRKRIQFFFGKLKKDVIFPEISISNKFYQRVKSFY